MSYEEFLRYLLYEVVDEHFYRLEVDMGLDYNRVIDMEVGTGRQWIERYMNEKNDIRMIDKIDFFAAHGIDVLKSSCKVSIYREWMDRQKDRQYKQILDKRKKRKTGVEKDADIEDIIKRRQNG